MNLTESIIEVVATRGHDSVFLTMSYLILLQSQALVAPDAGCSWSQSQLYFTILYVARLHKFMYHVYFCVGILWFAKN